MLKCLICLLSVLGGVTPSANAWPERKPKLVLTLVIDQFRADYLSRFEADLSPGGFKALMRAGAYFPYGEYDILQSMTGPGHATVLTGAYPYQMGIPLNDWYEDGHERYCAEDADHATVGAPAREGVGTSPRQMIGTTVGDELKNADIKSKSISVALKDRASILLGGHRADQAIWYDSRAKTWVTSTYYAKNKELPAWVNALNRDLKAKPCDIGTPCGIEMTADAVIAALGTFTPQDGVAFVTVSFSSHDIAGHHHGPNAAIMRDMVRAEDRAIASILKTVNSKFGGLANTLVVLTGDHGVAPSPAYLMETGIRTGNIDEGAFAKQIGQKLDVDCGASGDGKWIPFFEDFNFFLNLAKLGRSKCTLEAAEAKAKAVLSGHPAFAHVFTRGEFERRQLPPGMHERQILKTYYPGRSGNVVGLLKPFYINVSPNAASHMTGYAYDRMVPILFSGFAFKPGVYAQKAEVVDIAPTLAFTLGIVPPALSEGKVRAEALKSVAR